MDGPSVFISCRLNQVFNVDCHLLILSTDLIALFVPNVLISGISATNFDTITKVHIPGYSAPDVTFSSGQYHVR